MPWMKKKPFESNTFKFPLSSLLWFDMFFFSVIMSNAILFFAILFYFSVEIKIWIYWITVRRLISLFVIYTKRKMTKFVWLTSNLSHVVNVQQQMCGAFWMALDSFDLWMARKTHAMPKIAILLWRRISVWFDEFLVCLQNNFDALRLIEYVKCVAGAVAIDWCAGCIILSFNCIIYNSRKHTIAPPPKKLHDYKWLHLAEWHLAFFLVRPIKNESIASHQRLSQCNNRSIHSIEYNRPTKLMQREEEKKERNTYEWLKRTWLNRQRWFIKQIRINIDTHAHTHTHSQKCRLLFSFCHMWHDCFSWSFLYRVSAATSCHPFTLPLFVETNKQLHNNCI